MNDRGFGFASVGGVLDETGLTGHYDGEFAETLVDSLTRQLGLTLER